MSDNKKWLLGLSLLVLMGAGGLITTRQAMTTGTPSLAPARASSNGSSDSFARVDHTHAGPPCFTGQVIVSLGDGGWGCATPIQNAKDIDGGVNLNGCVCFGDAGCQCTPSGGGSADAGSATPTDVPVDSNTVGLWTIDDPTVDGGTLYYPNHGHGLTCDAGPCDMSLVVGNPGTTILNATGPFGAAVEMGDTSAVDEYQGLTNAAANPFPAPTGAYTLALWFSTGVCAALPNAPWIAGFEPSVSWGNTNAAIYFNGANDYVGRTANLSYGYSAEWLPFVCPFARSVWHHLVLVADGSMTVLYFDGRAATAPTTALAPYVDALGSRFSVGGGGRYACSGCASQMPGMYSHVRLLYGEAWSAAQVRSAFLAGRPWGS